MWTIETKTFSKIISRNEQTLGKWISLTWTISVHRLAALL